MGAHVACALPRPRGVILCVECGKRYPCASAYIEARIPADLNPWAQCAVLVLHSHTAEEACDDRCSTYER